MRGDTLLEVIFAVWLFGVTAFGLTRLQFSALHLQQQARWRMHAINLATAAAEALQRGYPPDALLATLRAYAAVRLPAGGLRLVNQDAHTRLIVLHWNTPAQGAPLPPSPAVHCVQPTDTGSVRQCVIIAIAQSQ
jgi:hypothetical protein